MGGYEWPKRPKIELKHDGVKAPRAIPDWREAELNERRKASDGRPRMIENWVRVRKAAMGKTEPFLRIAPEDNVIVGAAKIKKYLGIGSDMTLYKWIEIFGLPVVKRPMDGIYMTTMTAIDQWLFLATELDNENRAWGRSTFDRLEVTKRRVEAYLKRAKKKASLLEEYGEKVRRVNYDGS